MGKTKTRPKRRSARRPVQAPRHRAEPQRWSRSTLAWGAVIALTCLGLLAAAFLLGKRDAQGGSEGPASATGGLPDTPDYHSLLVAPGDPGHILLGTHAGLYESTDGGRDWKRTALAGQDAMNLARGDGEIVWTAGHNVFAKSTDDGRSWSEVRPDGLPSLDLHGFVVDPRDGSLWAAVAGEGLYRSSDGGVSFEVVSREVGGAVMALAITPAGRLLAGDMERGLLSSENDGRTWRVALPAAVMGLAINPADPDVVVAGGPGILRSSDGGETWDVSLSLDPGAGPVAWSASDTEVGYAVGFDRVLYRTGDRGLSWQPLS